MHCLLYDMATRISVFGDQLLEYNRYKTSQLLVLVAK